jgi:hypothetical protein
MRALRLDLISLLLLAAAGCDVGVGFSSATGDAAAGTTAAGASNGPDAAGGNGGSPATDSDAATGSSNEDASTPSTDAAAGAPSALDAALSDAALDAATRDAGDAAVDRCAALTLLDAGAVDAGTVLIASHPAAGRTLHFSSQDRDQHFVVKNVSSQNAALAAFVAVGYSVGLSYSTLNNTCTAGSTLAPGECCGWTTRYNTLSLTANDTVSLSFSNASGPQWPLTSP